MTDGCMCWYQQKIRWKSEGQLFRAIPFEILMEDGMQRKNENGQERFAKIKKSIGRVPPKNGGGVPKDMRNNKNMAGGWRNFPILPPHDIKWNRADHYNKNG